MENVTCKKKQIKEILKQIVILRRAAKGGPTKNTFRSAVSLQVLPAKVLYLAGRYTLPAYCTKLASTFCLHLAKSWRDQYPAKQKTEIIPSSLRSSG